MEFRDILRSILNPWVILGGVVFGGILFGLLLLVLNYSRPSPVDSAQPTPVVVVIPGPTQTPSPLPPTPTVQVTETAPIPPAPPEGLLQMGQFVQVSGTGGDGLRIRGEPGLSGRVLFLALEAEVFEIRNGPSPVDGYTWWYLVAPYDETRQGWAAANYLSPVQNP
jgi:hypothetical protein